jgi:predicted acyl esterase
LSSTQTISIGPDPHTNSSGVGRDRLPSGRCPSSETDSSTASRSGLKRSQAYSTGRLPRRIQQEGLEENGEVYPLKIDLHATSNYFPAVHRIRIEVSSSNFPRFDRNMNTAGNNFDESEGVVAENTVCHSGDRASYILLRVVH